MKISFLKSLVLACLLSASGVQQSYAAQPARIYISNNQSEITVEQAYQRLENKEQADLTKAAVQVLQAKHIEQGLFENVLSAYTMSTDKHLTAAYAISE